MRIVSGKYRHLLIDYPTCLTTRPTMDKVREAIINALRPYMDNRVVLDIFAGSGSLGLEALSNGAIECTFVDNNQECIKVIENNIKKLKIEEKIEVIRKSYESFLESNNKKYSLVFLDPPYKDKEAYDKVINYLLDKDLLTEDAIIIKEADCFFPTDERFKKTKEYKYGMIHVSIMWR